MRRLIRMHLGRVRRLASAERLGIHFAAVLFMGPLAALAILSLREVDLVAPSPIWLVPVLLVCGQTLTTACAMWWEKSPTRVRSHARIASQVAVVTATIYAIGWGPALAIGLVLVGQETLAVTGLGSQTRVLGWSLACLAIGQILIAIGWAPSLIPVPEVHGLAVLVAIGIAFSYRSLRSALVEKDEAAALTDSRERRFRALVQSSSDLVFVVDAARAVTYASPSCTQILGYDPEVLLGAETGAIVHGDELDDLRATVLTAAATPNGTAEFLIRVRHADGSWRWLEGLATNLLDDPAVAGMVINARDVTERRARMERQAAIADLGREVLQETSLEAVVDVATDVIMQMMPASGCRIVSVFDGPDAGHDVNASRRPDRLLVPIGDPDQPLAHIELDMLGPEGPDDRPFLDAVAGILLSAIIRTRAEDAIRHQAMHDPLTGLPNRTLFNDRLEHALRRRERLGGYVGVMIVDLDGFKTVNDSLGHLTGDALLIGVADRFRELLRGYDTIARLGGDEFAILVDDLDAADQAGRVAQRVLDALADPVQLPDRAVAIGASIGIALGSSTERNPDRLLSHADAAMYRAKREGKGCYRLFETAMHTAAVERMNVEQELRAAIAEQQLTVHYQPIVDTYSGRVVSFEALSRWRHETRGFVPPSTFIPLAEESGLIIDLGRSVLMEACHQAKRWRENCAGQPCPTVSVNASRLQLAHPSFVDHVTAAIASADLEPSALTLEVTESVLGAESGRILATLDALRRAGVRVAIDDFGTGYSSFAALAELPIDVIKIDKRFIDNLTRDHQGRGFVNAIVQLASTLQVTTIAEGVEHQEQREALAELGCSHIQGYLFARPMPADEALAFLSGEEAPEMLAS